MPSLTTDTGYFEEALGIVRHALHGRINHTAQTSFANDILCVAAELRSAVLIEQLYLNPNDIERIQSMFHHSLRFNHLDLLSIGDDHIFIIHRELLLEEINTYFSGSEQGLHHVFINVDYLLPQPEILEGSRYEPLDKYLRRHLLPDLQMRIQCWDQAEMCYRPLPTPDQVSATTSETETAAVAATGDDDDDLDEDFSMVTLSGWLKGYPVNYVLPTTAKMMARKRAARALKRQERLLASQRKAATKLPHHQQKQQQQQQEEMEGDQVLPTTATTTASHGSSECSTCVDDGDVSDGEGYDQGTTEDKDEEDDEEEEEEDSSHNSLANRLLVLTEINLSANESVRGLRDHCLLSFSYPASALPVQPPQQQHSRATTTGIEIPSFVQLPTASVSPFWLTTSPAATPSEATRAGGDQEMNPFEKSLFSETTNQDESVLYSTTMPGAPPPSPSSFTTPPVLSIVLSPSPTYLALPPIHRQHQKQHRRRRGYSRSRHPLDADSSTDDQSQNQNYVDHRQHQQHHHHRQHQTNKDKDKDKEREKGEDHCLLPPGNPVICAAGRSLLQVMHTRFQRQSVWKNWEVGQQAVTLPVVAL